MARHYVREGRVEDADRRFIEALAQVQKTAPDSHWFVGRAKSELGERRLARRAFAEAVPLLLQGFETLAADALVRVEHVEAARARIVALYDAWNRPEDEKRWRARAIR